MRHAVVNFWKKLLRNSKSRLQRHNKPWS